MTEDICGSRHERLLMRLCERGVLANHLHALRVADVVQDPSADFLEAATQIDLSGRTPLIVDATLRDCIEDYLNAAHQGRPFVDWRPDIGVHLFPSPLTGEGLSRRTLRKFATTTSHQVTSQPSTIKDE